MGLYFVLICSICVLLNVNGVKSVEEVDESILEKIIRADQGEGNGVQIQDFEIVQCEPPTPPENGYYVGPISLDMGSIVKVACNESYHLLGADFIECQAVPSPFRHFALWFHNVGTMSYSSTPRCIKEITTTEIRKDIQNELVRNMDKLKPPSPLFSMGGPQTQIHRRVYFPPETEHGKPEQKPEPNCKDDPVTGFCRASIPRYYFDTKSRTCEQFTYGGCGGNGNNYLTKEDCENTCLNGSSGWQS